MKLRLLKHMVPAVMLALCAASCKDDIDVPVTGEAESGEYVDVTFKVSTDTGISDLSFWGEPGVITRADNKGPGSAQNHIGKGEKIDMLIIAVYDENYTHLTQYGEVNQNGLIDNEKNTVDLSTLNLDDHKALKDLNEKHKGHTVVYFQDGFTGSFSHTVRLMRDKDYHIAFWAQSSLTDAYDTSDLEEVKVSYEGALNNDETRDAFCKVESFSVSADTGMEGKEVNLKRPFAQINVGAGTTKAQSMTGVVASQCELKQVSNCMDVVRDHIFGYKQVIEVITPEEGSAENEETIKITIEKEDETYFSDATFKWNALPEEKLKVDTENNNDYQEFDYMSMCYVLVPEFMEGETQNGFAESELPSVKVYFSTYENGTNQIDEKVEAQYVPVNRNWRTNFLSE